MSDAEQRLAMLVAVIAPYALGQWWFQRPHAAPGEAGPHAMSEGSPSALTVMLAGAGDGLWPHGPAPFFNAVIKRGHAPGVIVGLHLGSPLRRVILSWHGPNETRA